MSTSLENALKRVAQQRITLLHRIEIERRELHFVECQHVGYGRRLICIDELAFLRDQNVSGDLA